MFEKVYGHGHHRCDNPWDGSPSWAVELGAIMLVIIAQQEKIMASLDETLTAVTAEDTKVDGIIAFLAGIKQQLADALSGASLPPPVQAKVDAIFAQATASAGKIDTALAANVPAP